MTSGKIQDLVQNILRSTCSGCDFGDDLFEKGLLPRRGEFPETLCKEQGVVLSCRFAQSKVQWTSRVLWMAVVSQSSVKSSRRNSASSSGGSKHFSNKTSLKLSPCPRGVLTSGQDLSA